MPSRSNSAWRSSAPPGHHSWVPTVGKNLMSETTLYNIRTNEFAVGSSEGTVRTLFRPKDGIHYWNKQVGATP